MKQENLNMNNDKDKNDYKTGISFESLEKTSLSNERDNSNKISTKSEISTNILSIVQESLVENYIYGVGDKLLSNKRYSQDISNKFGEMQNNKKIKSEGDVKSKKEPIFFAKINDNYKKIFNRWKKIKSFKIDESGKVTKKLSSDDLIFDKCRELAIKKLKNMKKYDIEEILNILSYDNTNQNVLYSCFLMMKKYGDINNWLSDYKYCFCNINEIIDFLDNDNKKTLNLKKEFHYKFVFKNIKEGIQVLRDTIDNLILFAEKYTEYEIDKKLPTNNTFTYSYDSQSKVIKNNNNHKLFELGYRWLKNYPKIKDFESFQENQPFSPKGNKILYLSFCIHELYKPFIILKEKEGKITIDEKYLHLVYRLTPLLNSLMIDLDKDDIDEQFHYKISFSI